MVRIPSVCNALDSMVPISRFNKGEAGKIIDEIKVTGYKIIIKNNVPAGVLLTPERYKELVEAIEDYYLLLLAQERERNGTGVTYSAEEVYGELNIAADDLDEIPMEYGVDFE